MKSGLSPKLTHSQDSTDSEAEADIPVPQDTPPPKPEVPIPIPRTSKMKAITLIADQSLQHRRPKNKSTIRGQSDGADSPDSLASPDKDYPSEPQQIKANSSTHPLLTTRSQRPSSEPTPQKTTQLFSFTVIKPISEITKKQVQHSLAKAPALRNTKSRLSYFEPIVLQPQDDVFHESEEEEYLKQKHQLWHQRLSSSINSDDDLSWDHDPKCYNTSFNISPPSDHYQYPRSSSLSSLSSDQTFKCRRNRTWSLTTVCSPK